jgi:hypothetical protein
VIQTKLRVSAPDENIRRDDQAIIPVTVPDIDEIRRFADELHARNVEFDDEVWGWPVHYDPELPEPPVDSRLSFTPASFWIGVWPIWYVSLTWEYGRGREPHVLVGQENMVM